MNELAKQSGNGTLTKEATRDDSRYVTPSVDIFENDKGLTVVADLPGVEKDQIDVTVDNRVLTIKASAESRAEEAGYSEYKLMNYFRKFELGENIDPEKIAADYRNGVLTLQLPLAEKAKPRKIDVTVA